MTFLQRRPQVLFPLSKILCSFEMITSIKERRIVTTPR
jgi:hypothetical protein